MNNKLNAYNIIIIMLACCMGAVALGCMFFMLNFFTRQMQNMVGIVYEQDAAVAEKLLRGMFMSEDKTEYGLEAAKNLGYTAGAFELWDKVNKVYLAVIGFGVVMLFFVCGIVCCAVVRAKKQNMADIENEHLIDRIMAEAKAKEKYYDCREQDIQIFMENVAHQLKTPLAAVMVNLELIDGEDMAHDERLKEKCMDNIEHMKELLMQLLNSARLRVGKLHLNKKRMDIASLVDRLELENDGLIVENVPSCVIDADEEWLYQAVKNIVVNGLEYGKVVLRGTCEREKISLDIKDEGPGVNKSDITRMFDRYYTGESPRKDSTGIGLNLAYMVVKAHGGDIVVHANDNNDNGNGCTIRVSIPRYSAKEKVKIS